MARGGGQAELVRPRGVERGGDVRGGVRAHEQVVGALAGAAVVVDALQGGHSAQEELGHVELGRARLAQGGGKEALGLRRGAVVGDAAAILGQDKEVGKGAEHVAGGPVDRGKDDATIAAIGSGVGGEVREEAADERAHVAVQACIVWLGGG